MLFFRSTLQVTIRSPDEFQEIIVSPKMLTDHFPNNVCDMLALIKDEDMCNQDLNGQQPR